jgi:hypothetical protein
MKPLFSDALKRLIDAVPAGQRDAVRAIALAAFIEGTLGAIQGLSSLNVEMLGVADCARGELENVRR